MELGKKEGLYQPLINNEEGTSSEEVRLNPSDTETASNFVITDTYVAIVLTSVRYRSYF